MFREEKRLVSMLLCIALLLSMMPLAVFADGSAAMSIRIEASSTKVCVGDTIDYTIYATGTNITALQFKMIVPEGLRFVESSGTVSSDLKYILKDANDNRWSGGLDWTEDSMKWTAYNDTACSFPTDTVILTFSCVAEAAGSYLIELEELTPFDQDWQEFQENDTVVDEVTVLSEIDSEEPTIPDRPSSDDEPEEPTVPDEPTIPDRPSSDDEPEEPTVPDEPTIPDRPSSDDEPEEPTVPDEPTIPDRPSSDDEPEAPFLNISVETAATDIQVGDAIEFTVHGYGMGITALEFKLDIPTGLAYVAGSAECPIEVKDGMGWAAADWTEESMKWTGYNHLATDFDLILLTFSCVAEAAGTYEVKVKNLLPFDENYTQFPGQSSGAQVTVAAIPEACAHDYVGETTTKPSCEADGVITYTCSKCGESYTDMVPATGHTKETIPGFAATCTEDGLTEGIKCSVCGETLTAQEIIPATGHTEEVIPGSAATCTEDGLTEGSKCSVCGEILTAQEVIPATGHSYEAVVTEPTATEQGYTTYTCQSCGDSYVGDYVDALGMTLTGSYLSYLEGDVTLELVKDGKAEYTITAPGNTGDYAFTGVLPGSYILKVSKHNHVTREYEVTVDANTAPVDVKIHPIGDINGDGKVTVADVSKAYAHVKKATVLTGYEFLCADIISDGRISTADVSKAYAHAKKTTFLW